MQVGDRIRLTVDSQGFRPGTELTVEEYEVHTPYPIVARPDGSNDDGETYTLYLTLSEVERI